MSPEEYSSEPQLQRRKVAVAAAAALRVVGADLVSWAGMRHSNRSRRGRALFVFTLGIVLIVLASAFFFPGRGQYPARRRRGGGHPAGRHAGRRRGSLLPSVEDWFGARYELRTIQPLLTSSVAAILMSASAVRPRGPLVFRVAERMSLISDALEATRRCRAEATGRRHRRTTGELDDPDDVTELESPSVRPRSRHGRSRSGSTTGERTRRMTSARPSSDLAGCASQRHTRIANGSSRSHSNIANWRSPRMGRSKRPNFQIRRRRNAACSGLIVQVLPATQLVDLLGDVLLGLCGQPDRARRNTANTLVAHIRQPGQFLVELLVVLVVGEVGRLDTEEVGKGCHGGLPRGWCGCPSEAETGTEPTS